MSCFVVATSQEESSDATKSVEPGRSSGRVDSELESGSEIEFHDALDSLQLAKGQIAPSSSRAAWCLNEHMLQILEDYLAKQDDYTSVLTIFYNRYLSDQVLKNVAQVLGPAKSNRLFGNFLSLRNFHAQTLRPLLADRVNYWSQSRPISELFDQHRTRIEIYEEYLRNYIELVDFIDKCCEFKAFRSHFEQVKKEVFSTFSKEFEKSAVDFRLKFTIKSFLEYVLVWVHFTYKFLLAYSDALSKDHADRDRMPELVAYFKGLNAQVDRVLEEQNEREALKELQERLGPKTFILDRRRSIVKEGPVQVLSSKSSDAKGRYLVLPDVARLEALKQLDAVGMAVSADLNEFSEPCKEFKEQPDSTGFSVFLPCVMKDFKILATNDREKREWVEVLRRVSENNHLQLEVDLEALGKESPRWIPDSLSSCCFKCEAEFTVINRRHHCRACGFVFCDACSRTEAALEYDHERLSRVCETCFNHLAKSVIQSYKVRTTL